MTTSGSYTFLVQRDDIIRQAMLNIGRIGEGEIPTAQEVTDCALRLNMLVKQWQGRNDFAPGLKQWTRRLGALLLSGNQNVYQLDASTADDWTDEFTLIQTTLSTTAVAGATSVTVASISNTAAGGTSNSVTAASGWYVGIEQDSEIMFTTTVNGAPSGTTLTLASALSTQASSGNMVWLYQSKTTAPYVLETASLRDQFGNDTPLRIIRDRAVFENLPSKQNPQNLSLPTAVYLEQHLLTASTPPPLTQYLYIDCYGVQDISYRIRLGYMEEVQGFANPQDQPEYPPEWFLPLCWGLSKQIAPMFNLPFTESMEGAYRESLKMAQEANPDTTEIYFQPGNDGSA